MVAKGWRSDAGSNRTREVTTQVWSPCFDVACRFIIASGSLRVRQRGLLQTRPVTRRWIQTRKIRANYWKLFIFDALGD